jgi:acyl carrier protein
VSADAVEGLAGSLAEMIERDITHGVPVGPGDELLLSGLVDSIGVVRIVTWLEDHLAIEIDPVDVVLENFRTIELMVAYVGRR